MVRPGAEQIFDYVHEERNQFLHLRLERMLMEKIIGLFVSIIEQGNREKVWVVEYSLETMKILVIGLQQYLYGVIDCRKNTVKKSAGG